MGSRRNDQQPEPSRTEVISAYDEAFAVSEDGRPIPLGRGQFKTSGRYVLCPFYGQRVWQEPAKGGKGGGGKGGKAGGGAMHYNATIACVIAQGPLHGLQSILLNGDAIWSGPAFRATSPNPLVLSTKFGLMRVYWGSDDQPADPTLNQYAYHPPYPGIAYCVFVDYDHGSSTNAYNAEFVCLASCRQSVVTGDVAEASLDQGRTVNAAVFAAEILTAQHWLGRDPDALDIGSFQAVANALQAEQIVGAPVGRSIAAVSPLVAEATETRSILSDLLTPLGCWLRLRADGRVQAGRWVRDPDAIVGMKVITFDDLTEPPVIEYEAAADEPNSIAVEFTDSEALHKGATLSVDDAAAIAEAGVLRRTTIKRPWLITADQAIRAGLAELGRGGATINWAGEVRFPRALKSDGNLIEVGDYLQVPLGVPDAPHSGILRVLQVRRPKDATAAVQIEGQLDRGYLAPESAAAIGDTGAGVVIVPPAYWSRVLALPLAAAGDAPTMRMLAARPHSMAVGLEVCYDNSLSGDFPVVTRQNGFALPVRVALSMAAGATSARVRLLDPVDGANPRRDEYYLRGWSGGETEGRNDELLLILLKKDSNGDIVRQPGNANREYIEVLSIASAPTLVSADTWQFTVLRGRLGTPALAWNEGTFPAPWETYEGWVIPHYLLAAVNHNDFAGMKTSGTPGYFAPIVYTAQQIYMPAAAWSERQRKAAAGEPLAEFAAQTSAADLVPQHEYVIPLGI